MSHFTLSLILTNDDLNKNGVTKSVESALEQFDINKNQREFKACTAEEVERRRQGMLKALELGESDVYDIEYLTINKDRLSDISDFRKMIYGENSVFDEEGNLIVDSNPDGKFDYYAIGGRWLNTIETKDGFANYARIKDILFKRTVEEEELNLLKTQYEELLAKGDKCNSPEFMKRKYPSFESYLDEKTSFNTYAILTSDGFWYEPGRVWYESDPDDKDAKKRYMDYISDEDPENYLFLIDCHI